MSIHGCNTWVAIYCYISCYMFIIFKMDKVCIWIWNTPKHHHWHVLEDAYSYFIIIFFNSILFSDAEADLRIGEVQWGDSGVYICKVVIADDLEGPNEASVELLVLGKLPLLSYIACCKGTKKIRPRSHLNHSLWIFALWLIDIH